MTSYQVLLAFKERKGSEVRGRAGVLSQKALGNHRSTAHLRFKCLRTWDLRGTPRQETCLSVDQPTRLSPVVSLALHREKGSALRSCCDV